MAAPMQMAMNAAGNMAGKAAGMAADKGMNMANDFLHKMFSPDKVQLNLGGVLMAAGDRYVLNPFGKDMPGCCDIFCLCIGCTPKNLLYFTIDGKLLNVHNPGNCCCRKPWQVTTWKRGDEGNKTVQAKILIDRATCCSSPNGFAFSGCGKMLGLPLCQCSGHLKQLWITDEQKKNDKGKGMEKFVILQELVFCWVIGYTCAGACAPLGQQIASIKACCNFCNGRFIREITQPIYGAQASRDQAPNRVGGVGMMHMMCPTGPCTAAPCQTIKYKFQTEGKQPMDESDLASAALLLSMYRGMGVGDYFLPERPMFPQPMGVPCADMGLHAETRYMNVMDALKDGIFDM